MPSSSAVKGDQVIFRLWTSIRAPVLRSTAAMNCASTNRLKLRVCTAITASPMSNIADNGIARRATLSFDLMTSHPLFAGPWARVSERLPQGHEVLPGPHSLGSVQVVAKIDPDRAHRRAVAQAKSDRIRIIAGELPEVDVSVYVPTVVKYDSTQ